MSAARRPPSPIPSAAAGFTLLEMVLALTIFGMITATVYSAFYFGHRAVTSGERAADQNQRMRLAEELLGRQIRSAVFYFAIHEEDQIPFFLGASDGLTFVTSAPQSRGGMGLAVVTYRIADGRLILEERTAFTPDDLYDPPNDAPVERAVLLEGFSALWFEYLPREEVDLGWANKWDARDEDTLPAAVRISVEGLAYFSGQRWVRDVPLLTIAYGWGSDDFQDPPEDEDDDDNDDAGAQAADPDEPPDDPDGGEE
jgi:general secretion pathway protein J